MPDSIHSNWQSTDGDKEATQVKVEKEVTPQEEKSKRIAPTHTAYVRIEQNHISMRVAAVSGMLLVVMAVVTFYLGIEYLRGSVVDGQATVTITAQGMFEPDTLEVAYGDMITLINENANPQIIKNREDESLPALLTLFPNESQTFEVPASFPEGTYTFNSETLPEDVIFTLTILSEHIMQEEEIDTEEEFAENEELPIPSLVDIAEELQQTQSNSVSSVSSSTAGSQTQAPQIQEPAVSPPQNATNVPQVQPAGMQNQQPVFTIGQVEMQQTNPFANSTAIPINPYKAGTSITKIPVQPTQNLHPGAPLSQLSRPHTQPATGIHLWVFCLFAVGAVCLVTAKVKKEE